MSFVDKKNDDVEEDKAKLHDAMKEDWFSPRRVEYFRFRFA